MSAIASPPLARSALRGIMLRPATAKDLDFKRRLFAEGRAPAWQGAACSDDARQLFVAQQYAFQQRHIAQHHPLADLLVVEEDAQDGPARPIGRIDIDRTLSPWRLIDLALCRTHQSRGLGSRLVAWLQREACEAKAGIDLHLFADNEAAHRFYTRHGFVEIASLTSSHRRMVWRFR